MVNQRTDDMGAESDAGTIADEAKAAAREALDASKARTRSFFEEQKDVMAERVSGFAHALRSTARNLDEQGDGKSTSVMAERAARNMDRFARSLRQRDLHGLLEEAEDFARRQPAVFVGGAVTAGFLLARFLKSSHERRTSDDSRARERQYRGAEPAEGILNPSDGDAC